MLALKHIYIFCISMLSIYSKELDLNVVGITTQHGVFITIVRRRIKANNTTL
jgi:hypothetical protein